MKKLHLEILINAPRETVWNNIVQVEPYKEWAAEFYPGSTFVGSWEKGSKIRFIALDENGKEGGMSSEIADSRPHEFISIRHVGVIKEGVEDRTSEEVKKWTPSYENYTLEDVDGKTKFILDMDVDESYEEMFKEMWPKGLAKLKEISER